MSVRENEQWNELPKFWHFSTSTETTLEIETVLHGILRKWFFLPLHSDCVFLRSAQLFSNAASNLPAFKCQRCWLKAPELTLLNCARVVFCALHRASMQEFTCTGLNLKKKSLSIAHLGFRGKKSSRQFTKCTTVRDKCKFLEWFKVIFQIMQL